VAAESGWTFNNVGGAWEWVCIDPNSSAVLLRSERRFPTLIECIGDATRNGYSEDRESCESQQHYDRSAIGTDPAPL
jgi:hypothetical protein